MFRREQDGVPIWAVAAGAVAGATALTYGVLRLVRSRRQQPVVTGVDRLEEAAVEALRRDPQTGSCAIDVAAIAPGMIELTGIVPTHEVAQRAQRGKDRHRRNMPAPLRPAGAVAVGGASPSRKRMRRLTLLRPWGIGLPRYVTRKFTCSISGGFTACTAAVQSRCGRWLPLAVQFRSPPP